MQRPLLSALADRVGIEPSYYTLTGEHRVTSDETAALLLTAMGFTVESEPDAKRAVQEWDERERTRTAAPTRVLEESAAPRLELPRTAHQASAFHIELALEHGEPLRFEGRLPDEHAPITLELPSALPLGYHQLTHTLTLHDGSLATSTQRLIVVPSRCIAPPDRATGLAAQLYSVRGRDDSGVGDFGTLHELVDLTAAMGLDFVALSPLCALDLEARDVSPYAPTTRMALHPLYLDVGGTAVVDAHPQRIAHAQVLARKLRHARESALLRTILDAPASGDAESLQAAGLLVAIERYALFAALADHLHTRDCSQWPGELRDPSSAAVAEFAAAHADAIAFHRDLQLALDRQLGYAAQHARASGLRMGLVTDLPVGSASGGSDTWSQPELFARGVALGAPPDDYARDGQSWGLSPIVPFRSQLEGHRFFSTLVRRVMRHAGGVRIDHVLGFVRQYWVPDGHSGRDGAYLRCPAQEWLGIVALESARNACVVMGEDLGTVPDGLRDELTRRCMLRSHVLYFERAHDGRFVDPAHYTQLAIASALTHDLPSLFEIWEGTDLTRRHALGLFDADVLAREQAERARTRDALLACLRDAGTLDRSANITLEVILRALYEWLARTPAMLVIALDDLAQEPEGVNIPGTGTEVANWSRRMHRSLLELRSDQALCAWLRALADQRRSCAEPKRTP